MKILITGGAGFIGSAVCRFLINETDNEVVNLDCLTYAADLSTLDSISENKRYSFVQVDICNPEDIDRAFDTYKPDAVMHLAAESHVDRSIDGPDVFIQTNIVGTYNMLQSSLKYWGKLSHEKKQIFRFHHVSTDEVYGSLGEEGAFTEDMAYVPNSPYSATKAASDHLVRAWYKTFGLPVVISNCSNNYGPYQFPEKLIPVLILNALKGKPLPIYGKGKNIRDWLSVEDHARALYLIISKGRIGEKYNVGGASEITNIDVANQVCKLLDEYRPDSLHVPHRNLITYVDDRPGHDMRYAIDFTKIKNELGWEPKESFETSLRKTVNWYMNNQDWCNNIASGAYLERREPSAYTRQKKG